MKLDAQKFLEDLTGRHARLYTDLVGDMVVAIAQADRVSLRAARKELEQVTTETMGAAEVLGASIMLQSAAKLLAQGGQTMRGDRRYMLAFADEPTQTILPRVTFAEAVQDMVDRAPITIRNAAERTAQRISELYSSVRPMVGFARSAEQAVTERAQSLIAEAIREGIPEVDIGRRIVTDVNLIRTKTAAWSEGYARMAFRTNVNTAVSAGQFRQARDPDIRKVVPAFRFDAVGDADTRDNHNKADGIIMSVSNTDWSEIAPPLGYNCRCSVAFVGVPELRRRGLVRPNGDVIESKVPSGAFPDAGFRHAGRPDLFLGDQ